MSEMTGAPESTSDDRLWAALAYVLSPLVPIILLLWEEKKNRPFIKAHNMQALVMGIILFVIWMLLTVTVVGLFLFCIPVLFWIYMLYLGYQAYQGKMVTIPVVTNLVKGQN